MPARRITSSRGRVSANRLAVRARVSRTVMSLSSPPVCSTAETSPCETAPRGVSPNTRTVPPSGSERPSSMSIVVVLPAPFGPRKPKISP